MTMPDKTRAAQTRAAHLMGAVRESQREARSCAVALGLLTAFWLAEAFFVADRSYGDFFGLFAFGGACVSAGGARYWASLYCILGDLLKTLEGAERGRLDTETMEAAQRVAR